MDIIVVVFLSLLVVALFRGMSLWLLSIAYGFRKATLEQNDTRVSIIVPAYNEEKTISQSIESLLSQTYPNVELVVVDDGSSDSTYSIAKGFEGQNVKVVHQENKGKSEALNTGVAASTGQIILTVDADTRLGAAAVAELAKRFAAEPALGALAGNVKVDSPRGLVQRLQELEYTTGIGLVRKGQSMLSSVMIVPGPVAAFRKDALEKAGRFSSQTFAEDFDATLSILKQRYKVEYEDGAIAYTIAPKGVEDLFKQRRRWYRGMIQVLAKHEEMFMRKRYGVAGVYGIPFMWYDTVSPLVNLFMVVFAVLAGYVSGDWVSIVYGLSAYWLLQTIVAASAVALDKERHLWQLIVSPLLIFYNTFLDGIRTAALIEEVLSLGMKWEKPAR